MKPSSVAHAGHMLWVRLANRSPGESGLGPKSRAVGLVAFFVQYLNTTTTQGLPGDAPVIRRKCIATAPSFMVHTPLVHADPIRRLPKLEMVGTFF